VVKAVAEGDVAAGVAAEVEAVRVGELGGVPIGGADRREDPLARRDHHVAVTSRYTVERSSSPVSRLASFVSSGIWDLAPIS
jgi:hypothetical protein